MLNKKQIKYLKTFTHDLNPVVRIGQNGLTDNVKVEIDIALEHHELVKLKIQAGDRTLRDELINSIVEQSGSELIQKVGNIICLFKQKDKESAFTFPR